MGHRGVVAPEPFADLSQAEVGDLPGEEHRHLAGEHDVPVALLAHQAQRRDAEVRRGGGDDVPDRDLLPPAAGQRVEQVLHRGAGELRRFGTGGGHHAVHHALEFGDGPLDRVGDPGGDVLREGDSRRPGLLPDEGQTGVPAGALQLGRQAALEAAAHPAVEVLDLAGVAVHREHHLPTALGERIEGVEELLGAPAEGVEPGDELDVIHQEHLHAAVPLAQVEQAVRQGGVHHLPGERLALDGEDPDLRAVALQAAPDGVQQVGLAESGLAVDDERVVGGVLDPGGADGAGGVVGAAVAVPDHEFLEGVDFVRPGPGEARRPRFPDLPSGFELNVEVGCGPVFGVLGVVSGFAPARGGLRRFRRRLVGVGRRPGAGEPEPDAEERGAALREHLPHQGAVAVLEFRDEGAVGDRDPDRVRLHPEKARGREPGPVFPGRERLPEAGQGRIPSVADRREVRGVGEQGCLQGSLQGCRANRRARGEPVPSRRGPTPVIRRRESDRRQSLAGGTTPRRGLAGRTLERGLGRGIRSPIRGGPAVRGRRKVARSKGESTRRTSHP